MVITQTAASFRWGPVERRRRRKEKREEKRNSDSVTIVQIWNIKNCTQHLDKLVPRRRASHKQVWKRCSEKGEENQFVGHICEIEAVSRLNEQLVIGDLREYFRK